MCSGGMVCRWHSWIVLCPCTFRNHNCRVRSSQCEGRLYHEGRTCKHHFRLFFLRRCHTCPMDMFDHMKFGLKQVETFLLDRARRHFVRFFVQVDSRRILFDNQKYGYHPCNRSQPHIQHDHLRRLHSDSPLHNLGTLFLGSTCPLHRSKYTVICCCANWLPFHYLEECDPLSNLHNSVGQAARCTCCSGTLGSQTLGHG